MSCRAGGRGPPAASALPRGSRKIPRAGRDLRRWRRGRTETPKPDQTARLPTPAPGIHGGARAGLEPAPSLASLACSRGSSGSHPGVRKPGLPALRARPPGLGLTAGEGPVRPMERPRALEAARPGREFRLGSRAALCAVVNSLGLSFLPHTWSSGRLSRSALRATK